RGLMTDEEYLDLAAGYGYSYDRAVTLLALARQPYTTAEVTDLARFTDTPDEQLISLLREAGYDADRAQTLLYVLRRRDLQKLLDELATRARALYQTGRLSQPQLEDILSSAHFSQDEIGVILATEDLSRAVAKQLTQSDLLAAYRDQVLDAAAVRAHLRQLGYQDEDVDVLLAMQHKQLSPSQVLDLLTRGRITPEEAQTRLVGLGYSADDAAA